MPIVRLEGWAGRASTHRPTLMADPSCAEAPQLVQSVKPPKEAE